MKKMTLNNIYEWPLMTRLLLLGLIFMLAFYVGYRYDVSKQVSTLARVAQQEQDIKQELELVIHKSKMTEQEILRLPTLKAELSKWNKQLISYEELPQLLNQILKIGADNHLFFSLFTPGEMTTVPLAPWLVESPGGEVSLYVPPAPNAAPAPAPADAAAAPADANAAPVEKPITYNKVPIKVVVVGGYHDIAEFISQVANMQWIVAIGGFTISKDTDSALLGDKVAKQAAAQNMLSAEMILDVYTYPESK